MNGCGDEALSDSSIHAIHAALVHWFDLDTSSRLLGVLGAFSKHLEGLRGAGQAVRQRCIMIQFSLEHFVNFLVVF